MMKVNKLVAIAVLGLSVASCGQGNLKTKKALTSEIDSVSYALGVDMANQIKTNFGDDIDKDVLMQGFFNGLDSTKTLIKKEDTRNVLMPFFQKKRQEQMEKQRKEQEKKALEKFGDYKKENEQFLAENKTKTGVKTTASGLQYIVIKEGAGESPKETSTVKVHYKGTSIDGKEFDSSYKRKEPAQFKVNQVIKGWTEGLQLMKPGAKYKFFIPQELAYGAQQRNEIIKPFSTLVFEVELLEAK